MKVTAKRNFVRIILLLAAVLLVLCIAVADIIYRHNTSPHTSTSFNMGSVVSQRVYGARGDAVCDSVQTDIDRLDRWTISDTVDTSELSRINEGAGKYAVEVSDELIEYLKLCIEIADETDGAFNPMMGALIDVWDIDGSGQRIPSDELIAEKLPLCDYTKIQIEGNSVYLPVKGMKLHLGAAGKGMACDTAAAQFELQSSGVYGAVVSVGGSVAVWGKNPNSNEWRVGIRNPNGALSDTVLTIQKSGNFFVSTSGSYEKYFVEDGVKYHHILDYSAGKPAFRKLASVSVISKSGAVSDILSTACFVLPLDSALQILQKYECQAIFIYEDQSVSVTDGIYDNLVINNNDYSNIEILTAIDGGN